MSTPSKVIAQKDRQTDTHTQTHGHDENITSTAYAGGKNNSEMKRKEHKKKQQGKE